MPTWVSAVRFDFVHGKSSLILINVAGGGKRVIATLEHQDERLDGPYKGDETLEFTSSGNLFVLLQSGADAENAQCRFPDQAGRELWKNAP